MFDLNIYIYFQRAVVLAPIWEKLPKESKASFRCKELGIVVHVIIRILQELNITMLVGPKKTKPCK